MCSPGVDIIYRALKSFNIELLRAASQVREFLDQDAQDKIKILSQFVKDQEESQKAMFSKKSDDPDWFEGRSFMLWQFIDYFS